jgi:DNA-binding SARP family transcriptional activator
LRGRRYRDAIATGRRGQIASAIETGFQPARTRTGQRGASPLESHHPAGAAGAADPSAELAAVLGGYRGVRSRLEQLASDVAALELGLERALRAGDPPAPPVAAQIEIRCLGSFDLRLGGVLLPLPPGGKPISVVKFLTARSGRPTPRELLIDTLWPDADPAAGANRLRVALHALRQLLPEPAADLVAYADGAYRLDAAGGVLIDADEFERSWERALRLEAEERSTAAADAYRQAERLYRGEYLADDPYEEWTLVRREYLRDAHLNTLLRLAQLALERGDQGGCVRRCHNVLKDDRCSEEAYRLLMRSHSDHGQYARALRWFAVCEQRLREDLDTAPSPATLELRARILERRSTPAQQHPASSPRANSSHIHS